MWLSSLIIVPLVGAALLGFSPELPKPVMKVITWLSLLWGLAVAVYAFTTWASNPSLTELAPWFTIALLGLGKLNVVYYLKVDGLNAGLVLLSAIVLTAGASTFHQIKERSQGFAALYLLMASAVYATFLAHDFFLFFIAFEFVLLPLYFLVGLWGGANRAYAALKFLIYTLVGSVAILLAMVMLNLSYADPVINAATALSPLSGQELVLPNELEISQWQEVLQAGQLETTQLIHTFRFDQMNDANNLVPHSWLAKGQLWGQPATFWAFLLLLFGFCIKLPAVPFHTWLPDAHVQAPTAISMVLAGILLKVGGYGLLRIALPIFPSQAMAFAPFIAWLGVVSILYGALLALAQDDLKRLVAYSSISSMGYVLLGVASMTIQGTVGAGFQLLSHGILSPLLFLLVGMLYQRTGSRMIGDYAGLAVRLPRFTMVTAAAFFASLGLPLFSAFIAELLVFMGALSSPHLMPAMTVAAVFGLLLSAGYYLWTYRRMFMGPLYMKEAAWQSTLTDLNNSEFAIGLALVAMSVLMGTYPALLTDALSQGMTWVLTPQ